MHFPTRLLCFSRICYSVRSFAVVVVVVVVVAVVAFYREENLFK